MLGGSEAWYTLRRFMVARHVVAIAGEALFQDPGVRPEYIFQPVQPLLQLTAISSSQARFLSLLILTDGPIASTPPARRLTSVAFHLTKFELEKRIL